MSDVTGVLCKGSFHVSLELTQDFELASYAREGWIWDRKTLKKVRSLRSIRSSPGTVPTLCHSEPGDSPVRNLPSLAPFPDLPAPTPSTPHGIELVSYTREGWIWDRETLEKGPQPT